MSQKSSNRGSVVAPGQPLFKRQTDVETPEDRRKKQVLKSREEVIQQRSRAPGRTQTILTRRDG